MNGSSATLWGFEVAYRQRLSFLPGVLGALGLSANYGYTDSRANGVPGRTDHPQLQRQAPHTWNVSPTYDRGRLSVRVGMSYNGANIFTYLFKPTQPNPDPNAPPGSTIPTPGGLKGPSGDQYLFPHYQVDAQGSVYLGKGFTAIVSGLNLNNEVFGFYQGSQQFFIQREYYRPTYTFGLRWELGRGQ